MPNKKRVIAAIVLLACMFLAGYLFGQGRRKATQRAAAQSTASAAATAFSVAAPQDAVWL